MDEVGRIARLAWPVVLGQLGLVAMGVVDLLMVAPLGANATAGVGIGNSLSFGSLILVIGVAAGLDPLVTQAYGAGNPGRAGTAAARGAVVTLATCVPVIAVHLAAAPILALLHQPEEVMPAAVAFCWIGAFGVVPFAGFAVLRQLLQGGGVMRPAMWVIGIGNVVNLVGDWILVRWADLGVAGVAWCTVAVRWVMLGALIVLCRGALRAAVPTGAVLELAAISRVARIAWPVALQLGLEVWAFNACSFLAGALGANQAAAHTAALSAASVAFMVPLGVGAAAATRVGNLVGAGQDWRRAGAVAVGLGAAVMTVSAAVFLAMPHPIGRMYNPDPAVIALVASVLPVAAAFGWFDGTQVVAFGVLRGLGDTRVPMLFNVLGYWVIGLPTGAALAFVGGYGLIGVWIGLSIGLGVVTVLLLARLLGHSRPPAAVVG
jgi:multidrug resistance protein, MATE family